MGDIDFSMPGEYQAGVSFGVVRTVFTVHVLSQEDYLNRLDSLQPETERTLNLPAGGKDYVITPQVSGTYIVSLEPFTEEFNVYSDFDLLDMSGNRLAHGFENADDRYSASDIILSDLQMKRKPIFPSRVSNARMYSHWKL